jgi:threonine aldolase
MVYTYIPRKYLDELRKKYFFHVFDENTCVARIMCSFDTKKESIDEFVNNLKKIL